MAQFFHSGTVINSILFVGKIWNFTKKGLTHRSFSSSQIHKSMSRYQNKDIKILVALLPTLKIFLSVEINLEAMESVPQNCSLKKDLLKIFKNLQENTSAGVSFLKIRLKEKKGKTAQVFFRTLC